MAKISPGYRSRRPEVYDDSFLIGLINGLCRNCWMFALSIVWMTDSGVLPTRAFSAARHSTTGSVGAWSYWKNFWWYDHHSIRMNVVGNPHKLLYHEWWMTNILYKCAWDSTAVNWICPVDLMDHQFSPPAVGPGHSGHVIILTMGRRVTLADPVFDIGIMPYYLIRNWSGSAYNTVCISAFNLGLWLSALQAICFCSLK